MASIKKELKQRKAQQKLKDLQASRDQQAYNTKHGLPGVTPYDQRQKPGWITSTPNQAVSLPNYTPNQTGIVDTAQDLVQKSLSGKPFDNNLPLPGNRRGSFDPVAEQARSTYQNKTVPLLAERFLGGTNINPNSQALTSYLQGSGQDLESQLAGLQAEYGLRQGQQESNNFSKLLQHALAQEHAVGVVPEGKSFARNTWETLLPILAEAGVTYATGGTNKLAQGAGAASDILSGLANNVNSNNGNPNNNDEQNNNNYGSLNPSDIYSNNNNLSGNPLALILRALLGNRNKPQQQQGASGFTSLNNPLKPGGGTSPQNAQNIFDNYRSTLFNNSQFGR